MQRNEMAEQKKKTQQHKHTYTHNDEEAFIRHIPKIIRANRYASHSCLSFKFKLNERN